MITGKELRAVLRAECDKAGSMRAWALSNKLSPTTVEWCMNGRRPPAKGILAALGYRRIVFYEAKR